MLFRSGLDVVAVEVEGPVGLRADLDPNPDAAAEVDRSTLAVKLATLIGGHDLAAISAILDLP